MFKYSSNGIFTAMRKKEILPFATMLVDSQGIMLRERQLLYHISSMQNLQKAELVKIESHFSSVTQSCPTLCHPMNRSMPGLPVHHHLPEFTQTPFTSWQIDGETMETVRDFIFLGSKTTADGDCSHEIKRHLLLEGKVMTNLDSIFKSRDIILPTKVHLVKAMVFPMVMNGCES